MKYWFDTEFCEDSILITLISIGMVSEDGRKYHAVSNEFNPEDCNPWVKKNVLPFLPDKSTWKSKKQIKEEILEFVGKEKPEFWASYASYDWIVLCQLFGVMLDLPKDWPMFCRDIQQLRDEFGRPELPEQEGKEHDALEDAIGCKLKYDFLMDLKNKKSGPIKKANRFRKQNTI
jgi:hypothetical protein